MTRSHMKPIASVRTESLALFERYATVLANIGFDLPAPDGTDSAHLLHLCRSAATESSTWSAGKLSRTLGFVQGVMASRGQISADIDEPVAPSKRLPSDAVGFFGKAAESEIAAAPRRRNAGDLVGFFGADAAESIPRALVPAKTREAGSRRANPGDLAGFFGKDRAETGVAAEVV